ncbi:MFS transporter [Paraburkholderia graminis]|uniref:MFS transporter n=1 Tax=Paraburkholderia graminis TaxID=60548 RepID=UPI0038BC7795
MSDDKNLIRWKWLCYMQSLFALETFIAPVLVIFYTQYAGFSFSQYAILMSYIFLFSWAFQIPTGAIADKYGRKRALIFGNILYVIAMLSLVVFGSRTPIVVTSALFSFGSCLSTGAFQAMMYSAYAKEERVEDFNSVNARGNSLALLGGAGGAALGGILAGVSLALPMIVDIAVLSLTTVLLTIFVKQPQNAQNARQVSVQTIAVDAIRAAFASKKLFSSILVSAVAFACVRTGFNVYQPLLTNSGVHVSQLGLIFAGFSLFSAGVAYAYSKVPREILDGPLMLILIALAFILSSIFLANTSTTLAIICAICCHQFARAVYPSLSAYMININISDDSTSRTTILSLAALLRSLLAAVFSGGMALAAESFSDRIMFNVVSLVSAVLVLTFGFWSVYATQSKKPCPTSSRS